MWERMRIVGGEKFSLWQMCSNWVGVKPRLDNGLDTQPKGYRWNFWEIPFFMLLPSLGLAKAQNISNNKQVNTNGKSHCKKKHSSSKIFQL